MLVTTVNAAKTTEPIEVPHRQIRVGRINSALIRVNIGATWQIRWINLCGGDAGFRYLYSSNLFGFAPHCIGILAYIYVAIGDSVASKNHSNITMLNAVVRNTIYRPNTQSL